MKIHNLAVLTYVYVDGVEKNTKEGHYGEITVPQIHRDNTIKMESNPAYGSCTGLQPNPSYDVNKFPSRNTTEDQYDYAQPTQFSKHLPQGDVNMQSNPSYGVGNNMGDDVTIDPNPSYGVAIRMEDSTKIDGDSDYY